jgi:hypothetical protein
VPQKVSWAFDKEGESVDMASLLSILALGITILVPAVVWTLLAVGLFQLVRDSLHKPGASHQQVARRTRS